MPTYSSVETGTMSETKIVRFVVNIEGAAQPAIHVYEVQTGLYPGVDMEVIRFGGYRRICVAEQSAIKLNQLNAKTETQAFDEVVEEIKRNHSYTEFV